MESLFLDKVPGTKKCRQLQVIPWLHLCICGKPRLLPDRGWVEKKRRDVDVSRELHEVTLARKSICSAIWTDDVDIDPAIRSKWPWFYEARKRPSGHLWVDVIEMLQPEAASNFTYNIVFVAHSDVRAPKYRAEFGWCQVWVSMC